MTTPLPRSLAGGQPGHLSTSVDLLAGGQVVHVSSSTLEEPIGERFDFDWGLGGLRRARARS